MTSRLKDKTAVVTGGGTGIGLGIALALAREGARVAIAGRREATLREAVAAYQGQPPLVAHPVDVGDLASVEELFAWADQTLGRVDILVNCAGINVVRRAMADLSPEDWDAMLRINVTGAFYCSRAVLPGMRKRKDGLIVNISSVSGKRGSVLGGAGYAASKFAMAGFGATVAIEERQHGIRVSNVFPGEVETPILENRPVPVSAEHRARILQPEDVADAVLMIACLHPRAHVPELVIKPTWQEYA